MIEKKDKGERLDEIVAELVDLFDEGVVIYAFDEGKIQERVSRVSDSRLLFVSERLRHFIFKKWDNQIN